MTSPRINREARKVRAKLTTDRPAVPATGGTGTITAYAGGVATVDLDGSEVQAPRPVGYTPVVGDKVLVLLFDGSPVIVCPLTGFPTVV